MKSGSTKKLLSLLLALIMMITLFTGCQVKPDNSIGTGASEEPIATNSTGWNIFDGIVHPPIYDFGYN